jgi:hypothetical protein
VQDRVLLGDAAARRGVLFRRPILFRGQGGFAHVRPVRSGTVVMYTNGTIVMYTNGTVVMPLYTLLSYPHSSEQKVSTSCL